MSSANSVFWLLKRIHYHESLWAANYGKMIHSITTVCYKFPPLFLMVLQSSRLSTAVGHISVIPSHRFLSVFARFPLFFGELPRVDSGSYGAKLRTPRSPLLLGNVWTLFELGRRRSHSFSLLSRTAGGIPNVHPPYSIQQTNSFRGCISL